MLTKSQLQNIVDIRRRVEGWRAAVAPYGLFVLKKGPEGGMATSLLHERGTRLLYRGHDVMVISKPVEKGK
jgi:hypothetical protein